MSSIKDTPKPAADIKDELKKFDSSKLAHTETVEKSGMKHDMVMYGVSNFSKDKLHHTKTEEKVVLPDKDGEFWSAGFVKSSVCITRGCLYLTFNSGGYQ